MAVHTSKRTSLQKNDTAYSRTVQRSERLDRMDLSGHRSHLLLHRLMEGSADYFALLFFGKNLLVFLPGWMSSPSVAELLCPLIVTYFYCIVAKQLENVKILNRIGQNTLHLCGNEYIMNWLGISALGTLGLTPNLTAPISVCVYTVLTILTAVYLLIPIEKKVLRKLTEIIMDPLAKNKFKT